MSLGEALAVSGLAPGLETLAPSPLPDGLGLELEEVVDGVLIWIGTLVHTAIEFRSSRM